MLVIAGIFGVVAALLVVSAFMGYNDDHMLWGIGSIFVAGVFFLIGAAQSDSRARTAFMTQCLQDRKEYECVAMWRAGDSHTQVVPVVMPVR